MKVKVWGCRGSMPTPGSETVAYGGNTACLELELENGSVLVLDAGTGMRELGAKLAAKQVRKLQLLLTHLHLDHVEGLRFFEPIWDSRVEIDIWGPPSPVHGLKERLARSFSPPLFPIELADVPARVRFHDVPREPWMLEGARVTATQVVHPGPTVGYRIECDGQVLAYLPDHEPALTGLNRGWPRAWISGSSLANGADVLVHDGQYSEEEYAGRVGWGHSSTTDAIAYGNAVGARSIVVFHHDPNHDDEWLRFAEERAQTQPRSDGAAPTFARDGMVLVLG